MILSWRKSGKILLTLFEDFDDVFKNFNFIFKSLMYSHYILILLGSSNILRGNQFKDEELRISKY